MATVVEFQCPACAARCCAEIKRGDVARCPHCFNFVTVPDPKPQMKVAAPRGNPGRVAGNGAALDRRSHAADSDWGAWYGQDSQPLPSASRETVPELYRDAAPLPDDDRESPSSAASGPAMIVFGCTHCQTRIETDPANAGLACICPGCHVNLTIPGNARPIFPQPAALPPLRRGPLSEKVVSTAILLLLAVSVLIALTALAVNNMK